MVNSIGTSSSGTHSPAIPKYVLRGHTCPVHALHFFHSNTFLASGDSDGWVVIWSLASKRAVAVWRAHEGSILGLKDWARQKLVTHGRDHKLRVWQVRMTDFASLHTKLPVDGEMIAERKEPWLLHSMAVNALNFCAFALCYESVHHERRLVAEVQMAKSMSASDEKDRTELGLHQKEAPAEAVIIAVPNALNSGGIDFFNLPSEHRVSVLPADKALQTNMVMAVSLFHHPLSGKLTVISGYEDGHTMVHVRQERTSESAPWVWQKVLASKPHSQPLLSLDVLPTRESYLTSSADAIIAKFPIPASPGKVDSEKSATNLCNTKHAGQQSLRIRSDGKVFATAGWDARVRVYSTKTMRELAVLKWHKEGTYALAFADVDGGRQSAQSLQSGTSGVTPDSKTINNGTALDVIKHERSLKAQRTHWLAAGGKDGKISLWDIY